MPPFKQSLQDANGKMRQVLSMLVQDSGPLRVTAGDLADLLSFIQDASFDVDFYADNARSAKPELCEFHRNLEQLKLALPHLHSRLLAERARLELQRRELTTAHHFAEVSKRTP